MRILLCGERSFTAQGLRELLRAAGHEVVGFSRGPVGIAGGNVSGPVDKIHQNPHLQGSFDTVINYIFLAGEPIEPNLRYLESLLAFCRSASVRHLVHISSISAYKSSLRLVDEEAEVESDPRRKGAYGSVKAATDLYIQKHAPAGLRVSMVRPGFVLAPGLKSPIAGNGVRLPWGDVLAIGNPHSQFPLITRDLLNEALMCVVESPPVERQENLLVASPESPTRKTYLEACCQEVGTGKGVIAFPGVFWLGVVLAGAIVERLFGLPAPKLLNRVPRQRIHSRRTEQRLGMDLRFDWRAAVRSAVGGQQPNYELPYCPQDDLPRSKARAAHSITFLGSGRIVRTRHLPALEALGFEGSIQAHDAQPSAPLGGAPVRPISDPLPPDSDLYVVASPGPVHSEAIPLLIPTSGPVLVEKPLAYSAAELAAWKQFARERVAPVVVCHNYRFKHNVAEMLSVMQRFNPGELRHVHVHFESLPVSSDSAVWMRDERRARTLLMDYAVNLLDVACMFGEGKWKPDEVRYSLNALGQTSMIEGTLVADNYRVSYLLRQGFGVRMARIMFTFQNYDVSLGFFPETCAVYMSTDNPLVHLEEARRSAASTYAKVLDRLTGRQSDLSHATVIGHAFGPGSPGSSNALSALRVERTEGFYNGMFELAERVYGP